MADVFAKRTIEPTNRNRLADYDALDRPIRQHQPDPANPTLTVGTIASTFDAAGKALTRTNARGISATTAYDALGRITPGGRTIGYQWRGGLLVGLTIDGAALLSQLTWHHFGGFASGLWSNGEAPAPDDRSRRADDRGQPRPPQPHSRQPCKSGLVIAESQRQPAVEAARRRYRHATMSTYTREVRPRLASPATIGRVRIVSSFVAAPTNTRRNAYGIQGGTDAAGAGAGAASWQNPT